MTFEENKITATSNNEKYIAYPSQCKTGVIATQLKWWISGAPTPTSLQEKRAKFRMQDFNYTISTILYLPSQRSSLLISYKLPNQHCQST